MGFLDEVCEEDALEARTRAAVAELAPIADAYAASVPNVRGPALEEIDRLLAAERR